ncbi:MAG: DUF4157 domain-containing protein [Halobacteriota archaeon]
MKESVAIAKEADRKKDISSTRSGNSIHRVRNEPERQLGSLRGVLGNITRDGGTPSANSIATELSSMHTAQRASVLLALQRTHGNRYVQRVVAGIQAKLKVGHPGDIYEQEADRVADAVMRMPEPEVQRQPEEEEKKEEELIQTKLIADQITSLVRRRVEKEEEKEEEEEEIIQTKEVSSKPSKITPNLESRIQALRGSGHPLPESMRAFFEPRFGYDFSRVRIHADGWAAATARAVNAQAFTSGRDIVFGAGQYAPMTSEGRQLLAHELTHTIQQGAVGLHERQTVNQPENFDEQRTDTFAQDIAKPAEIIQLRGALVVRLQRQASRSNNNKKQDALEAGKDDGVGLVEARRALVQQIGEEHFRLLKRGMFIRQGEEEAERVASQVVSGGQAPTIARMGSAQSVQMAGPAVVLGAAAAAVVGCALGFYFYALDHYTNKNDKWLHCYTSCKIATYCGGPLVVGPVVALLLGAAKEAGDWICDVLGGPCGAEWEDFTADVDGVGCSYRLFTSCVSCCDNARP